MSHRTIKKLLLWQYYETLYSNTCRPFYKPNISRNVRVPCTVCTLAETALPFTYTLDSGAAKIFPVSKYRHGLEFNLEMNFNFNLWPKKYSLVEYTILMKNIFGFSQFRHQFNLFEIMYLIDPSIEKNWQGQLLPYCIMEQLARPAMLWNNWLGQLCYGTTG